MTPATEALVERLEKRIDYDERYYPPVDPLFVEAVTAFIALSADHVSDPRQMVSPPPAGEE